MEDPARRGFIRNEGLNSDGGTRPSSEACRRDVEREKSSWYWFKGES